MELPKAGTGDPAQPTLGRWSLATRGLPTEINFVNNLGQRRHHQRARLQVRHRPDPALGRPAERRDEHVEPHGDAAGLRQRVRRELRRPDPGGRRTCTAARSRPRSTAARTPGSRATALQGPRATTRSHGTAPRNYATYRYPNSQEAAPIWFHDHTLGATRLNVYAGLAGAYLLTDPANVPGQPAAELVPLVIQDRMFDTNGQLFFPADSAGGVLWAPNPEHPYWVPEFVGDVIVRQRQGVAVLRRPAEALPLPVPQRLERAHLRDVPDRPGLGQPGPGHAG